MRVRRSVLSALLAISLVGSVATAAHADSDQPPNDDSADAALVSTLPFQADVDTMGATSEPHELTTCGAMQRSVWWRITLAEEENVKISTESSTYNTVVGVYEESGVGSQLVGCDDDGGPGLTSSFTFHADAGTSYLVQVGGYGRDAGRLRVAFANPERPANDDLSLAETINGLNDFRVTYMREATLEPGEPTCGSTSRTLWYRFTATTTGPVVATTDGSNTDTTLGVYTGTSIADLTQVTCNDDGPRTETSRAGYIANAGETYLIQVGRSEDAWYGDIVRVGVQVGAAAGDDGVQGAVIITTEEPQVDEVGVEAVVGGARHTPHSNEACAHLVFVGACSVP